MGDHSLFLLLCLFQLLGLAQGTLDQPRLTFWIVLATSSPAKRKNARGEYRRLSRDTNQNGNMQIYKDSSPLELPNRPNVDNPMTPAVTAPPVIQNGAVELKREVARIAPPTKNAALPTTDAVSRIAEEFSSRTVLIGLVSLMGSDITGDGPYSGTGCVRGSSIGELVTSTGFVSSIGCGGSSG